MYYSVIKFKIYSNIPALFLIPFESHYSQNYSSIMCACLTSMQMAIAAVEQQEMTIKYAALCYGTPSSTLHDRISGKVKDGATASEKEKTTTYQRSNLV